MDNNKHKNVCLLLESSITKLFYCNDYIPQFPEQEPLIAKIVHFNSILLGYIGIISWILSMHYGNTNIETFRFSSGPPLKNLFFMYKTSDTGLIIEIPKSTRYSFHHTLKFKMLAQD